MITPTATLKIAGPSGRPRPGTRRSSRFCDQPQRKCGEAVAENEADDAGRQPEQRGLADHDAPDLFRQRAQGAHRAVGARAFGDGERERQEDQEAADEQRDGRAERHRGVDRGDEGAEAGVGVARTW